jgi:hypothetical protein
LLFWEIQVERGRKYGCFQGGASAALFELGGGRFFSWILLFLNFFDFSLAIFLERCYHLDNKSIASMAVREGAG